MKRHLIPFVVLCLLAGLSGCSSPENNGSISENQSTVSNGIIVPEDAPGIPERGFFMGGLITPAEGQTFEASYREAAGYADFVPIWGRPNPFYEMAGEYSGVWGDTFIHQYIRGNGLFPIVHMSFIGAGMTLNSPPGINNPTLDDPEWREAYKQAALDIVRAVRPLYFSIGNEVNRWYEQYGISEDDPNSFIHFISLYKEIYNEIKQISPDTVVFCTFAREIVSENRESDMSVLRFFDPDTLDLLVLTSYPHAIQGINRPSDITDNYYAEVTEYISGKPFGFSEVAWPSMDAFGGEQSQADFLEDLCGRLTIDQGVDLHLLGWSWLCDLDANDSIGLIKTDRTKKAGFRVWEQLYSKE